MCVIDFFRISKKKSEKCFLTFWCRSNSTYKSSRTASYNKGPAFQPRLIKSDVWRTCYQVYRLIDIHIDIRLLSDICRSQRNVIPYFTKYDEQIDDIALEVHRKYLCDRNIEWIRTFRGNWKFNYRQLHQRIVSTKLYLCKSWHNRGTESFPGTDIELRINYICHGKTK